MHVARSGHAETMKLRDNFGSTCVNGDSSSSAVVLGNDTTQMETAVNLS